MENPTKFNVVQLEDEFIDGEDDQDVLLVRFELEADDDVVATIRFEISPTVALVHPKLLRASPSNYKFLKLCIHKCFEIMLVGQYGFKKVHALTENKKLVDMVTDNKAVKVGNCKYGSIYEYSLEV